MGPRRILSASLLLLCLVIASKPLGIEDFGVPQPRNVAHAASGVLTPNVPNGNFASGNFVVGTPPTNYDFETGDLTGWSVTSGTVSVVAGGPGGYYAKFTSSIGTVVSSAFTLPANAQILTYDRTPAVSAHVLSGPTYSTQTTLTSSDTASGWLTKTFNVTQWAGQSIKLKFTGGSNSGIDQVGITTDVLDHWDVSGSVGWLPELRTDGPEGNYGRVPNGTLPVSEAFTVPMNASTLKYSRRVASPSGIYNLRIRCAPTFDYCASENTTQGYAVINDSANRGSWVDKEVNISDFAGQTIKLEFYNAGTFDWYLWNIVADRSARVGSVSLASGAFSHTTTDLAIPGKGVSLDFTRYYNSDTSASKGAAYAPLGFGWSHAYAMLLTFPTSSKVTVYYPGGDNATFTLSGGTYSGPAGNRDTLVKNGDNTYRLTTVRDVDFNFSSSGKLNTIVDRNGNTTSLTYDGTSGLLTTVSDPGGRSLSFTYTSSRISQIEDDLGRTVGYSYNSSGDLTGVTDVKGGSTSYAYANHQMTSFTDALTHEHTENLRDTYSRVTEQSSAVGTVTCYYYGTGPAHTSSNCPGVSPAPSAGQTVVVDPRAKKATYDFDSTFRITQRTGNDGGVTSYTRDSSNNITCVTDALGHKTAYAYDAKGNVTSFIDANNTNSSCGLATGGVQWTYTYTSQNDIDLETDARGNKTDYVYDSLGNLIELQRKDSSNVIKLRTCFTVPTSGTNKGLVTEVIESTNLTDCTGNKTKYDYDSYGNITGAINPRFSSQGTPPKTSMTYDAGGRMLTRDNELGHTTTASYDNMNKILGVEDELGDSTTNIYDAKGNLTKVIDANREVVGSAESGSACGVAGTGNGADDDSDGRVDDGCPSVTYTYNDVDRVTSIVDAIGKATSFSYDSRGNLVSVTNANRQAVGTAESGSACGTSGTGNDVDNDSDGVKDDGCPSAIYTYDNLNRLTGQKDALGNSWTFTYDDAGRLSTRTDAKGQVTTYGYSSRGDLTSVDYPTGTADVTFQYDAVGNRTQMADGTGTTTYSYDAVNRLTSVTFPGSRTVSYTYSNVGNKATITYPGGSNQVTYGYNEADQLTSVTDWNSNQTAYAYNDAGMLTTATLPSSTGVVGNYSYNAADRLTGISWVKGGSTTLASASYTLDAVGRRTQRVDGLGTHTYAYDAVGRLTSVTYPGPTTDSYTYDAVGNRLTKNSTSYTYDAADRLTAVASTSYSYDNNGNLTGRGSDSFSWDAADRLSSATAGGTTTTFAYNGDGLRDSLTTGSTTTTFTWDITSRSASLLDDGSFRYIYGLGRIAQVSGTTTNYYLTDALGSVMAICNGSGTVLNTYEYDVFGAIRSSTGSQANAFTFTGEQTDASTGLEYLRARYYDSGTGRFLSKDPAGSGYRYARGNPISLMDPSGLYEICGNDADWGYICFDSTQVGLPAEPPSSCDIAANTCEWEGGFTAAYEGGGSRDGAPPQSPADAGPTPQPCCPTPTPTPVPGPRGSAATPTPTSTGPVPVPAPIPTPCGGGTPTTGGVLPNPPCTPPSPFGSNPAISISDACGAALGAFAIALGEGAVEAIISGGSLSLFATINLVFSGAEVAHNC